MSLLFDARQQIGDNPGLHALVVGVSAYPYLEGGPHAVDDAWGMPQLSSTASTANRIVQWLRQARLPVPLATCRVLLSPSPAEAALASVAADATASNLIQEAAAWRTDASTRRDNVTFFYFAGHGVQRTKEDAVLCLTEFRQPPFPNLHHAVDLASLRGGMSPSPRHPDIARTQLYFIDACRVRPDAFSKFEPLQTGAVFDREIAGRDDRCSPVFFASVPNHIATAIPGVQTLFSRALLDSLAGEAGDSLGQDDEGDPRWGVSLNGLNRSLKSKIDDLNRELGADQIYTVGGEWAPGLLAIQGETPICFLPGPPTVDVVLSVDPAEASAVGRLRVLADGNVVTVSAPAPLTHPFKHKLPAGMYLVELSFSPPNPPYGDRTKFRVAQAPKSDWKITVV